MCLFLLFIPKIRQHSSYVTNCIINKNVCAVWYGTFMNDILACKTTKPEAGCKVCLFREPEGQVPWVAGRANAAELPLRASTGKYIF